MKRLLALDIGNKRIGVAVCDPLGIFAIGLETLNRLPEEKCLSSIQQLTEKYSVSKIIVGLPLNMKGQESQQTEDTRTFAEKLKTIPNVEIVFQDERLTSVLAQKILIEQKISPSRDKKLIDKKAAELILQQYLDTNKKRIMR